MTDGGGKPPNVDARLAGATLTIDLSALQANYRTIAKTLGSGTIAGAVVKADAYGLGIGPAGRALPGAL